LSSLMVLYIASTLAKAPCASATRTRVVLTGAVSSKSLSDDHHTGGGAVHVLRIGRVGQEGQRPFTTFLDLGEARDGGVGIAFHGALEELCDLCGGELHGEDLRRRYWVVYSPQRHGGHGGLVGDTSPGGSTLPTAAANCRSSLCPLCLCGENVGTRRQRSDHKSLLTNLPHLYLSQRIPYIKRNHLTCQQPSLPKSISTHHDYAHTLGTG
jgi:hypothetical protein